jgi:nucleotide-binding universal stress UspA family protein
MIVHVQEPPVAYGEGSFYYGVPDPDAEAIKEMLRKIKPHDSAVSYEHRFVEGDPAARIVELAKQEHADLIVMSSHGRTGLGRLLMGSVAECVMRHAVCPVLIVKPTAEVVRKVAVESIS